VLCIGVRVYVIDTILLTTESFADVCVCAVLNVYLIVILQGNMFAVTLYDTVYLYLKLASDFLKEGGNIAGITNGSLMYLRAQNTNTTSSK